MVVSSTSYTPEGTLEIKFTSKVTQTLRGVMLYMTSPTDNSTRLGQFTIPTGFRPVLQCKSNPKFKVAHDNAVVTHADRTDKSMATSIFKWHAEGVKGDVEIRAIVVGRDLSDWKIFDPVTLREGKSEGNAKSLQPGERNHELAVGEDASPEGNPNPPPKQRRKKRKCHSKKHDGLHSGNTPLAPHGKETSGVEIVTSIVPEEGTGGDHAASESDVRHSEASTLSTSGQGRQAHHFLFPTPSSLTSPLSIGCVLSSFLFVWIMGMI
jgi:hypothetical protein